MSYVLHLVCSMHDSRPTPVMPFVLVGLFDGYTSLLVRIGGAEWHLSHVVWF